MLEKCEETQKIKELEEVISRKDSEIQDIKRSLSSVLQNIRDLNESTDCCSEEVIRRRISELATNTIYELEIDKINELVNDNQSDN